MPCDQILLSLKDSFFTKLFFFFFQMIIKTKIIDLKNGFLFNPSFSHPKLKPTQKEKK